MNFGLQSALIFIGLLLALPTSLLADTPIEGVVTSVKGQPIAGATVHGSRLKNSFKSEETTTDQNGHFQLKSPGVVVHIFRKDYTPRAVLIKSGQSELNVVLEPLTPATIAHRCANPQRGDKRIGWGKYGLHFDVPEATAQIRGGKPDVDYVRYVITRKGAKTQSFLELWFGGNAMNMEPGDDQLVDSVTFQQRPILSPEGSFAGLDNRGRSHDGTVWRQVFVSGEGAWYRKASEEDAQFFDQIIDAFCEVPYPTHSPVGKQ